eukprot:44962-Alexandrium_andersonii.AAC.1
MGPRRRGRGAGGDNAARGFRDRQGGRGTVGPHQGPVAAVPPPQVHGQPSARAGGRSRSCEPRREPRA